VTIALCTWRFAAYPGLGARKRRRVVLEDAAPAAIALPTVEPGRGAAWRLLPRMIWLNFRETVKNVYFGVIALAGILFFVVTSTTSGAIFGTTTWPVTYQMLELVSGTFFPLLGIRPALGRLFTADDDRNPGGHPVHDALPIPTWLPFVAVRARWMLVPVVLQALLMLCGMAVQTAKGYHHYEPGLYVRWLFGPELIDYWLVCVLALTPCTGAQSEISRHFRMIVYFLVISFAPLMGLEHNLYKYGVTTNFTYSDMNGFARSSRAWVFEAYWPQPRSCSWSPPTSSGSAARRPTGAGAWPSRAAVSRDPWVSSRRSAPWPWSHSGVSSSGTRTS
jgi:hypothetical protein